MGVRDEKYVPLSEGHPITSYIEYHHTHSGFRSCYIWLTFVFLLISIYRGQFDATHFFLDSSP